MLSLDYGGLSLQLAAAGTAPPLNIPPFHFIFIFTFFRRVALKHSWFKGPSFKKEKIYSSLKYNLTMFTKEPEKVAQDVERKIINGTMRAWLLASL